MGIALCVLTGVFAILGVAFHIAAIKELNADNMTGVDILHPLSLACIAVAGCMAIVAVGVLAS